MYHETIKWAFIDIFALLKMDIAHLVRHALAGLMQLSVHCRACDIKAIKAFYIEERLNGINKKPVSVKSLKCLLVKDLDKCELNFRVCTYMGLN